MESPAKKLQLQPEADKENVDTAAEDLRYQNDEVAIPIKGIPEQPDVPEEKKEVSVAEGIKDTEADEPILQENPQRFVLFPIKYHEVRVASGRPIRPTSASLRVEWLHRSHADITF